MSGATDVETRPSETVVEPGDHDKFSHFVDLRVYDLTGAYINGTAVTAECGKVFIPTREPKFGECPDCQAIVDRRSVD